VNTVNLVTSVAAKHGSALKLLRIDPAMQARRAQEKLQDEALNLTINENLLDLTSVRSTQMSQDYAKTENLAHFTTVTKQTDQVISKQFWHSMKQRNVDLNEGSVATEMDSITEEDRLIESVLESARNGDWVLVCPIQFPQYTWKLLARLDQIRKNGEINGHFRLIYDFQGLTQSEIPDSFLFEKSVTFHVGPQNLDDMPTFNDIWSKILDPNFMDVLTDTSEGRQKLRSIVMH
jgi:hypothetical protein